jgi:sugar phosphate isomerase/epimerase
MMRYSVDEIIFGPTTLEHDVSVLTKPGVTAIGASRQKVADYGVAPAADLFAESGLAVSVLLGASGFSIDDRSRWPQQIDDVKLALDQAAGVEAACLLMSSGPPGPLSYQEAEEHYKEILAVVVPEAAARGVPLAFEHNHALRVDLGYVHSLHDALDLADDVDSPFFKICFEVNNAWIERHLYDDIAHRFGRIGLVQISDFAEGTLSTPERVALGDGIIPLERILRAFVDAGYVGYFDVEIVGPDVERIGAEEMIQRSIAYLARLNL